MNLVTCSDVAIASLFWLPVSQPNGLTPQEPSEQSTFSAALAVAPLGMAPLHGPVSAWPRLWGPVMSTGFQKNLIPCLVVLTPWHFLSIHRCPMTRV